MHATYTMLILTAVFSAPIVLYILRARAGKGEIYIRPIAGLSAIDEAVGRATEMGRPVLYSTGLSYLSIEGLCAVAILSHVARLAAKYDLRIIVPVNSYLLYPIAEEAVREAYADVGKLDLFKPEDVIFIPGQFPYAAGVVGIMHRERVAATFFFGYFAAESLILAEAGSQVGAIQVAGTPDILQIPFFITACDYTIIGEEFYAATAYLTHEPTMMGSLRGQDVGKFILAAFTALLLLFGLLMAFAPNTFLYNWLLDLLLR